MQFLEQLKRWLGEIIEVFLLLIAIGIAVQILFGSAGSAVPFFGGIVTNLTTLLKSLGDTGLVGLIALGIIVYLFRRRVPVHQQ